MLSRFGVSEPRALVYLLFAFQYSASQSGLPLPCFRSQGVLGVHAHSALRSERLLAGHAFGAFWT